MKNRFFFNNKAYAFNEDMLLNIFSLILKNEALGDEEEKYVVSFIRNSILRKSYDELDYHEFILEAYFDVPKLLCNITSILGSKNAKRYADVLSSMIKEKIDFLTTDYYMSLSASDAIHIAEQLYTPLEVRKVKILLSLMHLHQCALEDYEQSLDSFIDSRKEVFINGIGFQKIDYQGNLMLKPINDTYDSPIDKYKDFGGVLVPPVARALVFTTLPNSDYEEKFQITEGIIKVFYLKYHQLTGMPLENKIEIKQPFAGVVDDRFLGRWYNISKSDHPVLKLYTFTIDEYNRDGTFKRSRVFGSDLSIVNNECWADLNYTWSANENSLCVINNTIDNETISEYNISSNKLCVGGEIYYRTIEEALKDFE